MYEEVISFDDKVVLPLCLRFHIFAFFQRYGFWFNVIVAKEILLVDGLSAPDSIHELKKCSLGVGHHLFPDLNLFTNFSTINSIPRSVFF